MTGTHSDGADDPQINDLDLLVRLPVLGRTIDRLLLPGHGIRLLLLLLGDSVCLLLMVDRVRLLLLATVGLLLLAGRVSLLLLAGSVSLLLLIRRVPIGRVLVRLLVRLLGVGGLLGLQLGGGRAVDGRAKRRRLVVGRGTGAAGGGLAVLEERQDYGYWLVCKT